MMRLYNSTAAYILAGLAIGLSSAIYGLDGFGLKPVAGSAGWQEWRLSANDRFEPYAVGHFLESGKVPTPSSARYYVRSSDDDGNSLRGDCVVSIEGPLIPARWWSITIDSSGNVSDSGVLSAGKVLLQADGHLIATVSREPMAGNWMEPATTGPYQIIYAVSEPTPLAALELPRVKRSGC
jgi:hypothetical protein